MPATKPKCRNFAARLWPKDVERLEKVIEYLEITNPGPRVSFADAVVWLLGLPVVDKLVNKYDNHD